MLATGCASDDAPDNSAPSTVGFSISTRAAADPGSPGDPASDNEKINSYKIFIVDRYSRLRAIVEKTLTSAVEEDFFTADLPDGTYSFYALANITDDDINGKLEITGDETATNNIRTFFRLTQNDIAGKSVGELPTAPSLETIKSVVWRYMYVQNGFEGQIPMSGYRTDVKVTGKIEEAFSIEVVRMLAKVEFEFSSPNAEVPAHIKNVMLHATSEGPIPFMPDYSILGMKAPTLLPDVTAMDLSFNTDLTLKVGSNHVVSTGPKYLRESVATHPTGGIW